jgi:hypothetical protein
MAYLLRKGTRIVVRRPNGRVLEHICRQDTMFYSHDKVAELKTVQFTRDGFLVTVNAADLVKVRFQCPQCGCRTEIEGLCDRCRESWLPRR